MKTLSEAFMGYFSFNSEPVIGAEEMNALHRQALYENAAITRMNEAGRVATPENSLKYIYNQLQVDTAFRASILELRRMDKSDGRVKKIHKRMARDATKGGLRLDWKGDENAQVNRLWSEYAGRLGLNKREKLMSDARGCVMEGNLTLQWVIDNNRVIGAVRMPTETIRPNVDRNGRFKDPNVAYIQLDVSTGRQIAKFSQYSLYIARLDPDNYDDMGSLGRPYLDASRQVWKRLNMTEEDMVIRRRFRAPLRIAHTLDGASDEELEDAKKRNAVEMNQIPTDYWHNKKGTVTAIQGDANLDQVADVVHLLDTFYAGSPAPKGLFGYVGDLNRDVLEDLMRDYFEEIDGLQDTIAGAYKVGFDINLILQGINPEQFNFNVQIVERKTSTPNQRADLALKYQALRLPVETVISATGLDPDTIKAKSRAQANQMNPYPHLDEIDDEDDEDTDSPEVKITPGNQPKKESQTSITN